MATHLTKECWSDIMKGWGVTISSHTAPGKPTIQEIMAVHHKLLQSFRDDPLFATPITALPLSPRARNCLINDNLQTVWDILQISQSDLLHIPNLGRKSRSEVLEVLARLAGGPTPRITMSAPIQQEDAPALGSFEAEFFEVARRNARMRALRVRVLELVIAFPDQAYPTAISRHLNPKDYGFQDINPHVGTALHKLVELGELEGPFTLNLSGVAHVRNRKYYRVSA